MPNRCQYVDPTYNFPCGKPTTLAKITFQYPDSNEIITKYICKPHGDRRFEYLSLSEKNLKKQKDTNKITYTIYADKIKSIRWKKCRRCNDDFTDTQKKCNITYWYWSETSLGLRRSFQLHDDCMDSELKFFNIQSDDSIKVTTLDQHLE